MFRHRQRRGGGGGGGVRFIRKWDSQLDRKNKKL